MRKLLATLAILFCIAHLMPLNLTGFTPATVLGASVCIVLFGSALYRAFRILTF